MSYLDDVTTPRRRHALVAAVRDGWDASVGAVNPYRGGDVVLAKCWRDGYMTMLKVRNAATPAMQQYLRGRAAGLTLDDDGSDDDNDDDAEDCAGR